MEVQKQPDIEVADAVGTGTGQLVGCRASEPLATVAIHGLVGHRRSSRETYAESALTLIHLLRARLPTPFVIQVTLQTYGSRGPPRTIDGIHYAHPPASLTTNHLAPAPTQDDRVASDHFCLVR